MFYFSIACLTFIFSICVHDYYYAGDQVVYREFYENADLLNLPATFFYYQNILGAFEPLYPIFVSIFKYLGFDFIFISSLLNCSLICLIFNVFQRSYAGIFIFFLLTTNFYLHFLMFSAERLKFAVVIFLILFINYKKYLFPFVIATFSHFQFLILFLLRIFSVKYKSKLLIIIIIIILFYLLFSSDFILSKFYFYNRFGGVEALLKTALLGCYFFVINPIRKTFLTVVFFVGLSFFIGSERINMVMFFVNMYYLRDSRNIIFAIPILIYFSYKLFYFYNNIMNYGEGFNIV